MPGWKDYRRDLRSHLFHKHGETTIGEKSTVEQLESLHESFHEDKYACPPHEHEEPTNSYELGSFTLTYGEAFVEETFEAVK